MIKLRSTPKYGDVSTDVMELKDALAAAGFWPKAASKSHDHFGPKTKKAVSKFQKANGLTGTGVIGPKTLKLLGLEVEILVVDTGTPTADGAPKPVRTLLTKDIQGKKDRHVLPELRAAIEQRIFPGGKFAPWVMEKNVVAGATAIARALEDIKVREIGGNNRGKWVGLIQGVIGKFLPKGTGDAWCKSTMQVIVAMLEDIWGVESPVAASEHCMTVWAAAKKVPGLTTPFCEVGTMFEFMNGKGPAGHTGYVYDLKGSTMYTIEGNTGNKSLSDGDGLFYKQRNVAKNGNFTTQGFVRFWPNNKVPTV
jgi:peptidoglycan hydrolase-like protein with peptidoglycan-binding domain